MADSKETSEVQIGDLSLTSNHEESRGGVPVAVDEAGNVYRPGDPFGDGTAGEYVSFNAEKSGQENLPIIQAFLAPARSPLRTTRRRANLLLTPEAKGILERVGNQSEYASQIIVERSTAWQSALALLQGPLEHKGKRLPDGWHSQEIIAACDGLNGLYIPPTSGSLRNKLAPVLQANEERLKERWGLNPGHWYKAFTLLGKMEEIARALWIVVREYWTGNEELERRLGI